MGKATITAWAIRDIVGEGLTLKVVKSVRHYGHSIVTAHVDGVFDKRGLPDPHVLAFYFSCRGDRSFRLIILRHHSGIRPHFRIYRGRRVIRASGYRFEAADA